MEVLATSPMRRQSIGVASPRWRKEQTLCNTDEALMSATTRKDPILSE